MVLNRRWSLIRGKINMTAINGLVQGCILVYWSLVGELWELGGIDVCFDNFVQDSHDINDIAQGRGNSNANALELPRSCANRYLHTVPEKMWKLVRLCKDFLDFSGSCREVPLWWNLWHALFHRLICLYFHSESMCLIFVIHGCSCDAHVMPVERLYSLIGGCINCCFSWFHVVIS